MPEYRRILPGEFEQILALQNRHLDWVLDPAQKALGFLSTAFSVEQFRAMDKSIGIAVCAERGKIAGYLCVNTPEQIMQKPLQAALLEHCARMSYRGKPLGSYRLCVATHVCIDKDHRGSRAYIGLCRKVLEWINDRYDVLVSFVSTKNLRNQSVIRRILECAGEVRTGPEETFSIFVLPLPVPSLKRWPRTS